MTSTISAERCRTRECRHYGTFHSPKDVRHRSTRAYTALAEVTVELQSKSGRWLVYVAYGGRRPTITVAVPAQKPGQDHDEWMELRLAIIQSLSTARRLNAVTPA